MRLKVWQISAIAILLCVGGVAIAWWRSERHFDSAGLVECLPPNRATHFYIAVDALRDSGVLNTLAGAKAGEEPDYRRFVDETGFDYRTDLDAVAGAFMNGDSYFAVRGRFDWKKLTAYARRQGGECRNAICSMPASDRVRHISFYPLSSDVLALAVSNEERGVDMIAPQQWKSAPDLPPDPIWVSAPPFAFSEPKGLPAGAQSFLSPLAQGEHIVFAVGPDGQRFRIRLDVSCATPDAAAGIVKKLVSNTDLLKKMLEREKMTPNPRDLSGVLVAGAFEQQDKRVIGTWPVERGFLDALGSGKVE